MNIFGLSKLSLCLAIASVLTLSGCGPSAETRYDAGYDDGYAEGYNTTLKIRATIVEGDWNDKHYSAGYRDGRSHGVAAATQEK